MGGRDEGRGEVTHAADTADHQDGAEAAGFDTVLVLDFGAQYGQLIARRVRECHVHSQLIAHDTPVAEIASRRPKGIILSGGPMSVYVDDAPHPDPAVFSLGVPILGICYGAQLMALELGGTVTRTGLGEFGKAQLSVDHRGMLLQDLEPLEQCWMSHRDCVSEAPSGFAVLATTEASPVAAMEDRERGFYGVQFHPEVVHTPKGMTCCDASSTRRAVALPTGLLPRSSRNR
jgi:GMP synthase (glutamine-hydrolysing)